MYSDVQKGLLPLVGIPCLIIFYGLYRFGKRAVRGTRTFGDRMELLYSYTAAALLGQFLFQAFPNATGPSGAQVGVIVSAFIMLGFFVMLCVQKCQRVSHDNPYYVSPELNSIEIRSVINPETMEAAEYYHNMDPDSPVSAEDQIKLQDEIAELKKRRRLCLLTMIVMGFLCVFEGFFVVYREPTAPGGGWAVIIFFVIDKIMETIVVSVAMLHAYLHCKGLYMYGAAGWTVTVILSTTPVLANMTFTESFVVVNHMATSIFYAFAGGILFWIALYYIWIDRKRVDKTDTVLRLGIFGCAASMSWCTGYFI
jgi:zinc transporter ZupT